MSALLTRSNRWEVFTEKSVDWSPRESLHRVGGSSVAVMIMTATHTSILEFRLFAASGGLINT